MARGLARKHRKEGYTHVELVNYVSRNRADRRAAGSYGGCGSSESDRLGLVCGLPNSFPRRFGHGAQAACLDSAVI